MFCLSLFQCKKSPPPREGLPVGPAASHAGQTEERHRGNQAGPEGRRLQEEPGWFRPARRPRQLTAGPLELGLTLQRCSCKATVIPQRSLECLKCRPRESVTSIRSLIHGNRDTTSWRDSGPGCLLLLTLHQIVEVKTRWNQNRCEIYFLNDKLYVSIHKSSRREYRHDIFLYIECFLMK